MEKSSLGKGWRTVEGGRDDVRKEMDRYDQAFPVLSERKDRRKSKRKVRPTPVEATLSVEGAVLKETDVESVFLRRATASSALSSSPQRLVERRVEGERAVLATKEENRLRSSAVAYVSAFRFNGSVIIVDELSALCEMLPGSSEGRSGTENSLVRKHLSKYTLNSAEQCTFAVEALLMLSDYLAAMPARVRSAFTSHSALSGLKLPNVDTAVPVRRMAVPALLTFSEEDGRPEQSLKVNLEKTWDRLLILYRRWRGDVAIDRHGSRGFSREDAVSLVAQLHPSNFAPLAVRILKMMSTACVESGDNSEGRLKQLKSRMVSGAVNTPPTSWIPPGVRELFLGQGEGFFVEFLDAVDSARLTAAMCPLLLRALLEACDAECTADKAVRTRLAANFLAFLSGMSETERIWLVGLEFPKRLEEKPFETSLWGSSMIRILLGLNPLSLWGNEMALRLVSLRTSVVTSIPTMEVVALRIVLDNVFQMLGRETLDVIKQCRPATHTCKYKPEKVGALLSDLILERYCMPQLEELIRTLLGASGPSVPRRIKPVATQINSPLPKPPSSEEQLTTALFTHSQPRLAALIQDTITAATNHPDPSRRAYTLVTTAVASLLPTLPSQVITTAATYAANTLQPQLPQTQPPPIQAPNTIEIPKQNPDPTTPFNLVREYAHTLTLHPPRQPYPPLPIDNTIPILTRPSPG